MIHSLRCRNRAFRSQPPGENIQPHVLSASLMWTSPNKSMTHLHLLHLWRHHGVTETRPAQFSRTAANDSQCDVDRTRVTREAPSLQLKEGLCFPGDREIASVMPETRSRCATVVELNSWQDMFFRRVSQMGLIDTLPGRVSERSYPPCLC